MKVNLSINEQDELFTAYYALDSHHRAHTIEGQTVIERVPYVLGTARRIVVRNILILKASLTAFTDVKKSYLFEVWPQHPPGIELHELMPSVFPEGLFDKWKKAVNEAATAKDEVSLIELPHTIYDSNEFPLTTLVTLQEHGLILEPTE